MSKSARSSPRCIIITGPNGAGKTTFGREFLSKEANIIHFVNPDLIASGLSPLRPELAALAAGRLFLRELHRLVKSRVDFAFHIKQAHLHSLAEAVESWRLAGRNGVSANLITATRAAAYRRACKTRGSRRATKRRAAPFLPQLDQFSKTLSSFSR
jgi:hypothetical protein